MKIGAGANAPVWNINPCRARPGVGVFHSALFFGSILNGNRFLSIASQVVGPKAAEDCAHRIGDLDSADFPNDLLGFEALAFYIYTHPSGWQATIDRQLSAAQPDRPVSVFAAVLNGALRKLPPYRWRDGLVFRGHRSDDPETFLARYPVGSVRLAPSFLSAALRAETAFGGDVLFMIRALSARAIWFLAASYKEDEVLFPARTRLRVEQQYVRDGRAVVLLQEI